MVTNIILVVVVISLLFVLVRLKNESKSLQRQIHIMEGIFSRRIDEMSIKIDELTSYNEATDSDVESIKSEQKIILDELDHQKKIIRSFYG